VTAPTNWSAWHKGYDDERSALSRRLRVVQRHIALCMNARLKVPLTAISVCAGQGHDLLGVLATRADAHRIRATLLEYDESNVSAAQTAIATAGLRNVTVKHVDAGDLAAYEGAVPADLVLMAGVFGNISDADVRRTIGALPQLCAPGATVIWTRTRREPDLTPRIRRWLQAAAFVEHAFHAPPDVMFSVGVHHFTGAPQPLAVHGNIFQFLV
jgi:ubiquinone/menaquinone biosynthesis C-methylase UbiE